MRDYSQWETKNPSVTGLRLDAQNPRIPPTGRVLSQHELLCELVEHNRVYELARSIVANGYYPTEILVVVREGDERVVIEGNRRLAALKLLISPDAAPEEFQRRFRSLSEDVVLAAVRKVPVIIAPSREAATPLIIDRHTHRQIDSWQPQMQARFYRSLLNRGATQEELCERYSLSASDLAEFLRVDTLYRLACSLDLKPDVAEKVRNPRAFPVTTLKRAIEYRQVRDFLGVNLDDEEVLVGHVPKDEFAKGFSKLVSDIAEKHATSRTLHDEKAIAKYLTTFGPSKPDLQKKGRFKAKDLIKGPPAPKPKRKRKRKPKKPRHQKSLIPRGFTCGVASERIENVFNEIKKLHADKVPNACAIMLRVLLDLSVTNYLEESPKALAWVKAEWHGKKKRPDDWWPTLRKQLKFLLEKYDLGMKPLERKALRQIQQKQDRLLVLDSLDGFAHNKQLQPTESELRALWSALEPLLAVLLAEPPRPAE